MVEIKPFAAVIYNFKKIGSPHKVICPPYDIISPTQARSYKRLSCYNMVHLTLPERTSVQDKYQVASERFHNWLEKKVLLESKDPAIYFYQQEFQIDKRKFRRLGFIACLGLRASSDIYGHEHTHIAPKEDRFKLLVKVRANLEPIFVLFSDRQGFLQKLLKKHIVSSRPFIHFRDRENSVNTVWRVKDPRILKKVKASMADKKLFIADGHHRYEVSLNYQELMRRDISSTKNLLEDFNYIMAYFCPVQSPGLVIRPVHRLAKAIEAFPMQKLKKYFYIQKVTKGRLFNLLSSRNLRLRMIGMYFNKNFYIAILKDNKVLKKIDRNYRHLDIYLLNYLILDKLLKIRPEDKDRLIFSANVEDLVLQADIDKSSLVFFVEPVKISDIIELAKRARKMPAKTTYFYPKVPSGLVMYKF